MSPICNPGLTTSNEIFNDKSLDKSTKTFQGQSDRPDQYTFQKTVASAESCGFLSASAYLIWNVRTSGCTRSTRRGNCELNQLKEFPMCFCSFVGGVGVGVGGVELVLLRLSLDVPRPSALAFFF